MARDRNHAIRRLYASRPKEHANYMNSVQTAPLPSRALARRAVGETEACDGLQYWRRIAAAAMAKAITVKIYVLCYQKRGQKERASRSELVPAHCHFKIVVVESNT